MIDRHRRDLKGLRQAMNEGKVSVQTFGNVREVRRNKSSGYMENIFLFERRCFVVNFVIW